MGTYSTQMRTDAESLLHDLAQGGRLVHLERLPAAPARTGSLSSPLPDAVWKALGVPALWSHQAAAIDLARQGRSVVVATGTASGKSLCYQAADRRGGRRRAGPARPCCCSRPRPWPRTSCGRSTALDVPGLVAATYDGDTVARGAGVGPPPRQRACSPTPRCSTSACSPTTAAGPRSSCGCATSWSTSCTSLRGIFGTHVGPPAAPAAAAVRRATARRRRSCSRSATIGEPGRLAVGAVRPAGRGGHRRRLAARRAAVRAVEPAAARRGDRARGRRPTARRPRCWPSWSSGGHADDRLLPQPARAPRWWPPTVRRRLPEELADDGAPVPRRLPGRGAAGDRGRAVRRPAAGRRGHERPRARRRHRRARRLRARRLPRHHRLACGSRPGGPGAAQQRSLAVLVAGDDQLDQWLMAHPREVFTPAARAGGRQPGQPVRARSPTSPAPPTSSRSRPTTSAGGATTSTTASAGWCSTTGCAPARRPGRTGRGRGSPAPGRRAAQRARPEEFRIAEPDGRLVGTVDEGRAFELVHPGAVYLHQGQPYRVDALDLDDRVAVRRAGRRRRVHAGPHRRPSVRILATRTTRGRSGGAELHLGAVEVAEPGRRLPAARHRVTGEVLGAEDARPAADPAGDPGVLVRGRRPPCSSAAGVDAGRGAGHAARRRARRHRHPAAVHHLRPVGRGRRVDHRCRPTPAGRRS